ncbi:alpha/beta family hydrolase [Nitratireductor sp. XY-223]|uniref:alpha/beta hydrolase family protein n=1 Tax=Nitratireductor sp. XY-223 TaxID=2561926 RepID=UPI0010AAB3DE|nr:alpha/beta family hydrolase [Nitratireductor sp. XY-223]
MMDLLVDGPADAGVTILFAHGAGAPMDSPAMNQITEALVAHSLRIARFEFAYMAARRADEGRKPPPRAEKLVGEYHAAIAELAATGPLVIGGKSMGGRVASMIADDCFASAQIAGLLCVGYPFHPPNKPETLRTKHLKDLQTPTLICQGTRDPFGTKEEVPHYDLSENIRIEWFEDGDHDLRPRKKVTGMAMAEQMARMGSVIGSWFGDLGHG